MEYCVLFYPFFVEDLTNHFLKLLKAKFEEIDRTRFLIDNKYFKCSMPSTKNEEALILEYVNKGIEETGELLKQSLEEFNKKKMLFKKIKRRLGLS